MLSEVLSAGQMRRIESAAMSSGRATGLELMERAGQGVVDAIFEQWPELQKVPQRALVLCGPGNNGGDGFVVARLLREAGWRVDLYLLGQVENLPPDARINSERWLALGTINALSDDAIDGFVDDQPDTCLVIDALFGTGLVRPFLSFDRVQMQLNTWQAMSANGGAPHVVSIDLPSGLCADSGRYLGYDTENPFDTCIMANLTVTFHRMKLGHVLSEGAVACGKLVVKDIGCAQPDTMAEVVQHAICDLRMSSLLSKAQSGHKFTNGAALVLSGGFGKSGAARLAARAALRVGAGLVTLGVPAEARAEVAAQITALMMCQIDGPRDLERALGDTRINALCLGPGLGRGWAEALLDVALAAKERAVVLDADALSAFEAAPERLFDRLHTGCVLTPHMGEFARLFPDLAALLKQPATTGPAYSKVDAVRAAASRAGCCVLLKGPDTVIADDTGRVRIHSAFGARAAPWLATAGAGDVLAGFITGLMARGVAPLEAASIAAHLHVSCAIAFGPGLVAEDLPEMLPRVLAQAGV